MYSWDRNIYYSKWSWSLKIRRMQNQQGFFLLQKLLFRKFAGCMVPIKCKQTRSKQTHVEYSFVWIGRAENNPVWTEYMKNTTQKISKDELNKKNLLGRLHLTTKRVSYIWNNISHRFVWIRSDAYKHLFRAHYTLFKMYWNGVLYGKPSSHTHSRLLLYNIQHREQRVRTTSFLPFVCLSASSVRAYMCAAMP